MSENDVIEKPVVKESKTDVVALDVAVRLAAGLLAGPNISHQDTKTVAELAVKHAYALLAEIRKESEKEKRRVAVEESRVANEKKAADAELARSKKAADDKAALEKKKLEEEKRVRDQQVKDKEAERHAEKGA